MLLRPGKSDSFKIFKTVDLEIILPSLRNSPTIRRAPQRRLFVFISTTRRRTSSSVAGRPMGFWRKVHLRAASLRRHDKTVLGLMVAMLSTTPFPSRNRETRNNRSHEFSCGRFTERCKIYDRTGLKHEITAG